MSIEMYVGMVTGIIVVLIAVALGIMVNRRRSPEAEDERVRLIRAEAGSLALKLSAGVAFIGWVADNLSTYAHGGAIQTITPWSTMLLVMVAAYTVASAIQFRRYSVSGEPVDRKEILPVLLLAFCVVLGSVTAINTGTLQVDPGLEDLVWVLDLVVVCSAIWLLFRFWRSGQKLFEEGQK